MLPTRVFLPQLLLLYENKTIVVPRTDDQQRSQISYGGFRCHVCNEKTNILSKMSATAHAPWVA